MTFSQSLRTVGSRGSTTAGVAPDTLPLFRNAMALIATMSFSTKAPWSSDQSFGFVP